MNDDGQMTAEEVAKTVAANMECKFERKSTERYQKEFPWLLAKAGELAEDASGVGTITLFSKYTGGQKKFVGSDGSNIWVDGYIPELNTVLEYHGCYYHGHVCPLNPQPSSRHPNVVKAFDDKNAARMARTKARVKMLKDLGLTVIEHFECQDEHAIIANYDHLKSQYMFKYIKEKPASWLVEQIKDGRLFGLVECDIQVRIFK